MMDLSQRSQLAAHLNIIFSSQNPKSDKLQMSQSNYKGQDPIPCSPVVFVLTKTIVLVSDGAEGDNTIKFEANKFN